MFFWNSQKLSDQGSNEEGPAQLGSPKSESIRNDNEWTDLDSFVEETESGSSLTDIKLETYAGTTLLLEAEVPTGAVVEDTGQFSFDVILPNSVRLSCALGDTSLDATPPGQRVRAGSETLRVTSPSANLEQYQFSGIRVVGNCLNYSAVVANEGGCKLSECASLVRCFRSLRLKTKPQPMDLLKILGIRFVPIVAKTAAEVREIKFGSDATQQELELLSQFPQVEILSLESASLLGDNALKFQSIRELSIVDRLTAEQTAAVASMQKLEVLNAILNFDVDPTPLGALTNLRTLRTGIDGRFAPKLQSLSACTELAELELGIAADASTGDLGFLRTMPNLRRLTLHGSTEPETAVTLTQLHSLEELNLTAKWVTPEFIEALSRLRSLSNLALHLRFHPPGTLGASDLASLKRLKLKTLRLHHGGSPEESYVTAAALEGIKEITSLEFLHLNVPATQKATESLAGLPKLKEFVVSKHALDEAGFEALGELVEGIELRRPTHLED